MGLVTVILFLLIFSLPFVNAETDFPDESNYLILVNKDCELPKSYEPSDLRKVDVSFMDVASSEREMLRDAAASALEEMFKAAEAEGIYLLGISGYRSYKSQEQVYKRGSNTGDTDDYIAKPGYSEHQTGLAIDIGCQAAERLSEEFADSEEGKWVQENAHKYGYIIRYPKEAEEITGYKWEPWHIRYVGEAATTIYESGLVLETYLLNN